MKAIPLIFAAAGLFLSHSVWAADEKAGEPVTPPNFKEDLKGGLETKGQVLGMQELPITKLFFVEAEQGTYLISSDGRFVFEGTLKDVWHRRTIRSIEDVKQTQRTPVSNIGFKPEEQLAHFIVGNPDGPRQGVAFVDPTSDYTRMLLEKLESQSEEGHWTLILMPMVGGNSAVDRALRLWCATDREQALVDLKKGTSESFEDLQKDCNDEKIMIGMMLTDLFRISSLPHLIREDGLISQGLPQDFDQWFSQP